MVSAKSMSANRKVPWKWMKRALALSCLILGGCAAGVLFTLPTGEISKAARTAKGLEKEAARQVGGVHFVTAGKEDAGVTFLFVHGTPGELGNWGGYLGDEELGQEFQMVAFDRLGHGKSDPGEAVPKLADQAAALAQVAGKLKGKRIWVGHSYGVPVIGRLAKDHPGLVNGTILVAGPAGPEYVRRTWYQSLAATDLGQAVISRNLKVANVEMLALEEELEELSPAWAKMNFPVTVIHAKNDMLAKFKNVAYLKERLPGETSKVLELDSGNHFLIWNRKELVMAEMRKMAEEISR